MIKLLFFFIGIFTAAVTFYVISRINDIEHQNKLYKPIGFEEAQAMFDNRYPFFSLKEKTRCIWFSYNEIDSFLKSSFQAIKERGETANQDSVGVRIYFAAYTEKYNPQLPIEGGWKNRRTVFWVPTYKINHGATDVDIVNVNSKNFREEPFLLGGENTTMNHGTLCPPEDNCDGSAFKK